MVWQVDLSGKCIVVTGGNRGIGLAISHQIAQAGAHVAIIYRKNPAAPDVAKAIAEKYGVRCVAYQCDVSDQEAIVKLFREIYHDVGPVGGVVCSAGVQVVKPALDMKRDDFRFQMEGNVWGCLTCAQAAAALWKEHGYQNGRIVFVSSMSATIANDGVEQCLYNASKGALTMLAKALAMEWADQGVLVNNLSPGFVDTDMNQQLRDDPELNKYTANKTMLKRIGTADEQAGMVVFFLSDYANYLTAQEVIIDGGKSSW